MKKETDGEIQNLFGRMIKGISSLLLKEGQVSDSQNMLPHYQGWKQRKGISEHTTSAIASSLQFKSMIHYRDLKAYTNAVLAHVYDSVNGERIMKQTTLPTSTVAGNTWEEMYDLTASCEDVQFALVAGSLIAADDDEFLVWHGEQYLPTGVWKYINSATAYIDFFDEVTDYDSTTVMPLDSLTTSDYVYVVAPMPLNKVTFALAAYNSSTAIMSLEKYNGSWTELTITDGTGAEYTLDDTWPGSTLDEKWTETDASAQLTVNDGLDLAPSANVDVIVASDFKLTGDFDIYVQWSALSWTQPSTGNNLFHLEVYADADNHAYMGRGRGTGGSNVYRCDSVTTGSADGEDTAATTDNAGYFRITRASAVMTFYYGEPGSWTQLGQDSGVFTDNVQVRLYMDIGDNTDWVSLTWDGIVDNGSATYVQPSLYQDGGVTWTVATDEVKTIIEGQAGYAYRFSWDAALDAEVEVSGITVHSPMAKLKSQWPGIYMTPTGCYVYDGTDHTDYTLYVGNTVEAQYLDLASFTTTDKLYIGFPFRTNRIVMYPAAGSENSNNVSLTAIKYHNLAGAWTSVGSVTDTTETNNATLSQKGYFEWADPGRYSEKQVKVGGDDVPWYWYEVTVDAAMSDPSYVYYIQAVPIYDDPDPSLGCFGWKRRAWQIAPRNRENMVRFSAENLIDIWGGTDSGYVEFGERPLKAAAPFYNETFLGADTELWMLQGNTPENFGRLRVSGNIGVASPSSMVSVETGVDVGGSLKNVVVWLFYDGFWMFDGVRLAKISSPDIDSFFDSTHDDFINPTYLSKTKGIFDHETQCGMWSVYSGSSASTPTKVLVLHFPTLWYGILDYGTDVGPFCKVFNNKYYMLAGGHSSGKTYLLHDGFTDVNSSGTAVAVDAFIITRDMFASYSDGLQQRLLSIWIESQTGGGQLEVDGYPDGSKTPQGIMTHSLRFTGRRFGMIQKPLKDWPAQTTTKFRLRNRSQNGLLNILGFSTTIDKGRADE